MGVPELLLTVLLVLLIVWCAAVLLLSILHLGSHLCAEVSAVLWRWRRKPARTSPPPAVGGETASLYGSECRWPAACDCKRCKG